MVDFSDRKLYNKNSRKKIRDTDHLKLICETADNI